MLSVLITQLCTYETVRGAQIRDSRKLNVILFTI
eukprot:SAG31_NODE_3570_length_4116_cov_2.768982_2_plen_33_part_01